MPNQQTRIVAVALLATIGLVTGSACSNKKDKPDSPEATPSTQNAPKQEVVAPKPKPSVRSQHEVWRPMLDEVSRAEIDISGAFIDFGDAATHKWVMGGWKNAWGENRREEDDGTSYTQIKGSKADIPFISWQEDGQPKELVARLRGRCGGQKVALRIDGKDQGDAAELTKDEWTTVRVPVAEPIEPGWHEFGFLIRGSCGDVRADVDWVWMSEKAGADPPEIVDLRSPLKIGEKPMRALPAPTPRSYAWHVTVPENAKLVFDYAATAKTNFVVTAREDRGALKKVFESDSASTEWTEGVADLGPLAGKTIRLELETTGEDGMAGWGEVAMMVPPRELPKAQGESKKAKNVVMIVIDTVRGDVFEPYGGGTKKGNDVEGPEPIKSKVQTPAFDALVPESTVFSAAYDNENWTKPSCATILTGLYPTTHDTKQDDSTLPQEVTMISERLKDEGFATGSFIANGYVSEKYGFNQGWDHHTNFIREYKNTDAENVYNKAIEWLDKNKDDRFFLYIQTIDPHVPYRVDKKYTDLYYAQDPPRKIGKSLGGKHQQEIRDEELSDDELAWIKALYYGEVTYHDQEMGRFVQHLRDQGLFEDTLFIVTNDHGEELKEHGLLGHGHSLYDEVIRAPLLVRYPGKVPANQIIDDPVETVDIVPTILDVTEVEAKTDHDGFSLMPLIEGQPLQRPFYAISEFLYSQRAIRVGPWKYIRSGGSWAKLFHVGEDPTEQTDLAETALIGRRLAEIHLGEALANPDKRKRMLDNRVAGKQFNAGVVEMDPELKKQLEALGYFGDE